MTTMSGRPVAEAGVAAQRRTRPTRAIRVRQSPSEELYEDSDSESFTKRRTLGARRRRTEIRTIDLSSRRMRPVHRRQAVSPPDDEELEEASESSDSSDSDIDGEEGEDSDSDLDSISSGSEDEEEEAPVPGRPDSPSTNPGFQTLVPAPGPAPSLSSQPAGAAPTETQLSSSIVVTLSTSTRPTEAPSTTGSPENDEPVPDSEFTSNPAEPISTIIDDPSSPSSDSSTGDAASSSQISDGDSSGPRGEDIGIVLGTLALAALLILAGILLYRKRKQSNQDHMDRLPDEKPLPEPPTFQLTAPQPSHLQRRQSSIMDEAMGAAYQAEAGYAMNGNYQQNNLSRDFQPVSYQNTKSNAPAAITTKVAPDFPVSPVSPAGNLSPAWTPSSPRTQANAMHGFQLFPSPTPAPMVPPPPPAQMSQHGPSGFEGSNGFAFVQPRMSMARTEVTDKTEGTWSTFANERLKANGGKLPLKERMFGHF